MGWARRGFEPFRARERGEGGERGRVAGGGRERKRREAGGGRGGG